MEKSEEEKKAEKLKQIAQLKCEVFDIIRKQEILQNEIGQLQNIKIEKINTLTILEKS